MENVIRIDKLGRRNCGFKPGEEHWCAKLSAATVREIRRRHTVGHLTMKQLGALYGVRSSTVSNIVLRNTWRHIPEND